MDEKIPLSIPCYLNKYMSMTSGGLKIEFVTQENISPELLTSILSLKDKLGNLFFGVRQIEAVDLLDLPKIDASKYMNVKTPSQRLRAVLWLWFCQEKREFLEIEKDKIKINAEFELFYSSKMDLIINWIKEKLE